MGDQNGRGSCRSHPRRIIFDEPRDVLVRSEAALDVGTTPEGLHIQKVGGVGGSENHLLALLPALRDRGRPAAMLVLAGPGDRPEPFIREMNSQGVPVHVMHMIGDVDPLLPLRLALFIRRGRFRWVHTHLFHADLYGTLAARLSRVRYVVSTRHGLDSWRKAQHWAWIDRMASAFQTRIVVVSSALRDWLLEFERLSPRKLHVIPLGIDPRAFCAGPAGPLPDWPAPVIGAVSRLIPQKGVDVLVRAFALCRREHASASLVIVGEGPSRTALEKEVSRLGLQESVYFLGFRTDVSTLMARFDVFAFPTLGDGFGLVLLEAMAVGCAIVASDVLSVPQIVRGGETGLLVPPGDAYELAGALGALLRDPALRGRLGHAGRRRLETEFTLDAMVSEMTRLYDDALGEEGHGEPSLWPIDPREVRIPGR
jgi:glycosyltransferase involved in cell wall biosynthesis